MTRWMASKGAKRIILASRSSQVSNSVQNLIKDLASEGIEVVVRQCDVSNKEDISRVVSESSKALPIRGVIHSAMVLHVSRRILNITGNTLLTTIAGRLVRKDDIR